MNSLVLLIGGIAIFVVAYIFYGGYLAKKWGLDNSKKTPAERLNDNIDYVPTDARVLFGHHFSSIAGAGPITGPILAAAFGWIPVYLWIVIGSVFFGGVHDFGSLAASIDNDGKSIGEIIHSNVSTRAKTIFNWYAWLTIGLVVAAFTDICASTFAYNPENCNLTGAQAGTASMIFILLAFVFGFCRNKLHTGLGISTILGVILVAGAIVLGYFCPVLKFNKFTWDIILIVYICLASVLPVWLLLQPRDYLCSFLLYAMMAGAIIGVFVKHPTMDLTPFAGMYVKGKGWLFPILFVTIACGAISGFHSLISSGTTSKQLAHEKDAQAIGYGAMLVEGLLAIVALIVVGYVSKDGLTAVSDGSKLASPAVVFSNGVAAFMHAFGIPEQGGKVFVTLAYSAFALTSLDTATRIGRYLLQELAQGVKKPNVVSKACSNMYVATALTIVISVLLLVAGYAKIWPIFGSANQLLAALALLAVTAWMLRKGKKSWETIIPMIFMFAVTFTALIMLVVQHVGALASEISKKTATTAVYLNHIPLVIIACVLFVLAILQVVEAVRVLSKTNKAAAN
ncbi:MAG: carbon starvation protein A [Treponema sp.]